MAPQNAEQPARDQTTAVLVVPVTAAVNCCCWLGSNCTLVGVTPTFTGRAIVTLAVANFVGSACEYAVTVIVGGEGTWAGVVYSPVSEIVPQLYPTQPAPLTFHLTWEFWVPFTVAVNCCWVLGASVTVAGDSVTEMGGGGTIVTVAAADAAGFASELAMTLMLAGVGAFAGAVYSPLPEIVPQVTPVQPLPDMLQVTIWLLVPVTVALNCCVPPVLTWVVDGVTTTATTSRNRAGVRLRVMPMRGLGEANIASNKQATIVLAGRPRAALKIGTAHRCKG